MKKLSKSLFGSAEKSRESLASSRGSNEQIQNESEIQINQEFIEILARLKKSPEDKRLMLDLPPDDKYYFLKRYRKANYSNEEELWTDLQLTLVMNHVSMESQYRSIYYKKPTDEKLAIISNQKSQRSSVAEDGRRSTGIRSRRGSERVPSGSSESVNSPIRQSTRNSNSKSGEYQEKTPGWYICEISNRNTSPKSLERTLISLITTFSLGGARFVHEFIKTTVPHLGTNGITGISCMEVALDRVCLPSLQPAAASSAKKNSPAWYAESTSPDEIRLEVLNCIEIIMKSDFGLKSILSSHGLLRQIFWCLAMPSKPVQEKMLGEARLGRAYIHLHGTIFALFGPTCLLDEVLKNSIMLIMREIQKYQMEPYPFNFLVLSLCNPFAFGQTSILLEEDTKVSPNFIVDRSDIWVYRAKLVQFINGLVSSSHALRERVKARKVLEASGFKNILAELQRHNPPKQFLVQMNSYLEDRENDLKEQETLYQSKNDSLKDATKELNELLKSLKSLPQPEMARNFLMSTISNLNSILKNVSSKNEQAISSEERSYIFSLVKNSTKTVANSLENWDPNEKGTHNIKELQRHYLDSVEGAVNQLGNAETVPGSSSSSNIKGLYKELEATKRKLQSARETTKILRKEIEFLNLNANIRNPVPAEERPRRGSGRRIADDPSLAAFWLKIQKNNVAPPEALKTLGKTADMGMLWEEIYRLEAKLAGKDITKPEDTPSPVVAPPPPMAAPPPPPAAPAPPPPGAPAPPGAAPPSGVNDKIIKAKIPMKPLNWQKLAKHNIQNSNWVKIFDEAYQKNLLNSMELDKLFSKTLTAPERSSITYGNKSASAKQIVSFLDRKSATNIEIVLSSRKFTDDIYVKALLEIDDEIISLNFLSNIQSLVPAQDVFEQILGYDGPMDLLGRGDVFMRSIYVVPRVKERMHVMLLRLRFYQEFLELEPDIQTVLRAITQVRRSKTFQKILQFILVIGNYLNGTTFRGNAFGFKIDSLLNLDETSAEIGNELNCTTLTHYLALYFKKQAPECLELLKEMPDVYMASRTSIPNLIDGVKELGNSFNEIKSEIALMQKLQPAPGDKFLPIFMKFYESNSPKVKQVEKEVNELSRTLEKMFVEFAEDPKARKAEPQLFFDTIYKFGNKLKAAKMEFEALKAKKDLAEDQDGEGEEIIAKATFMNVIKADPDAILHLKPVDGQDPFYKRLTVRGDTYLKKLFNPENPDEEGVDNSSLGLSNLLMNGGNMATARKTIHKSKSKNLRSSIYVDESAYGNALSTTLNAYANTADSGAHHFNEYDTDED